MPMRLGGLLVVERFDLSRKEEDTWITTIGLSIKDVLKRYRGFDSDPWPEAPSLRNIHLEEGLASTDQYEAVHEYFVDVSREGFCDLLYLQYVRTATDGLPHPHFHLCGYDFGHYGGESNFFSVLLHEVINGHYEQLQSYHKILNEHFLLSSLDDADRLKQTRDALKLAGAGLETEDDEDFVPIGIHVPKDLIRLV